MATQVQTLEDVLKNVEKTISDVNKEAALLGNDKLTKIDELTIKFTQLSEQINFSGEALLQLKERIAEAKVDLKAFAGSAEEATRDGFAKVERFVLYTVDTIVYAIKFLYESIAAVLNAIGMLADLSRAAINQAVSYLPEFMKDNFDYAKKAKEEFRDAQEHAEALRNNAKNITSDFKGIVKTFRDGYSESDTIFTNAFFGLSRKARQEKIKELEIEEDRITGIRKKLLTEQEETKRKLQVETGKTTRDLILDQIRASSKAAIDQYKLEARLARAAFDLAFDQPFNIQLQSAQSGLDQFAAGYQKDFNKFLQTLVPDASFDITKLIFKEGKGSSFLAEGFMNALTKGLSDRKANIKDLQSSDIIEALGGKELTVDIVESVMNSAAVVTAVASLTEKGISPLIEDQLTIKSAEFLEKYASNLVKTILSTQVRLMMTLRKGLQSVIDEESNLRFQVASDKFFKKAGKTRLAQFAKENFLITQQRELNRAIEISKHAREGLDINANTLQAELARKTIEVKDNIAKITREKNTQKELDAREYELIDSGRKIKSLILERDELIKGSSELEIQKKKR